MDRMVIAGKLEFYPEILANVRNDGKFYPIRPLIQVDDPEVREIARVLVQSDNFIEAAHEFVNSFTSYQSEMGDFWATPGEMLTIRAGDCDDSAILLCSLLRNYIPPDKVFVAFGVWTQGGKTGGHAWVVMQDDDGGDMVLESTSHPRNPLHGKYTLSAMFNDTYCFATDIGIKDFDLKTEKEAVRAGRQFHEEISYA